MTNLSFRFANDFTRSNDSFAGSFIRGALSIFIPARFLFTIVDLITSCFFRPADQLSTSSAGIEQCPAQPAINLDRLFNPAHGTILPPLFHAVFHPQEDP